MRMTWMIGGLLAGSVLGWVASGLAQYPTLEGVFFGLKPNQQVRIACVAAAGEVRFTVEIERRVDAFEQYAVSLRCPP